MIIAWPTTAIADGEDGRIADRLTQPPDHVQLGDPAATMSIE